MLDNFLQKFEFRAVQKCANLVDLEKCCKMIIWWPKSVLIQPRTSLTSRVLRSWRSGGLGGAPTVLALGLGAGFAARGGRAQSAEPKLVLSSIRCF